MQIACNEKRWLGCLVALLLTAAQVGADEPKDQDKSKEDKPATPAEQFEALQKEYREAEQAFSKKFQELKTDEERAKHFEQYPVKVFAGRFLELAEKNPKDPKALDALTWVATRARATDPATAENWGKAVDIITRDHITDSRIGQIVPSMVYSYSAKGEQFLRTAMANSPHPAVKGGASLALAKYLKGQVQMAEALRSGQSQVEQLEKFFGKERVQFLLEADLGKIGQETEALLEEVVEKYADLESYRGTLGKAAESELFEIRNLAIGKVAPDIEGKDIDGEPFKISDYRGKVVVLDFWGHW